MTAYRLEVCRGTEVRRTGTAWFAAPDLLVTAFHVVGAGEKWLTEEDPTLEFRLPALGVVATADLFDAAADLATLEIKVAVPAALVLPVAAVLPPPGRAWSAPGFPEFHGGQQFTCHGTLQHGAPGDLKRALQLHLVQGTTNVAWEGVSGSPVLVDGAVVGVVTDVTEGVATAWATATGALRRLVEARSRQEQIVHPLVSQLLPGIHRLFNPLDLYEEARKYYRRSDFRKAVDMLDRCLAACGERNGIWIPTADALRMKASAQSFLGYDDARTTIIEALELSEHSNDLSGLAEGHEVWGWIELQRGLKDGRLEHSADLYRRALDLSKDNNDCIGSSHYGLGRVLLGRVNPRAARWHFQQGLSVFKSNPLGKANCEYGLGLVALSEQGLARDLEQAESHFEESMRLYLQVSNNQGSKLCRDALGRVEAERDRRITGAFYRGHRNK